MNDESPVANNQTPDPIEVHIEMINELERDIADMEAVWPNIPEWDIDAHESHIELLRAELREWYISLEQLREESGHEGATN